MEKFETIFERMRWNPPVEIYPGNLLSYRIGLQNCRRASEQYLGCPIEEAKEFLDEYRIDIKGE